jgi:DNA polymerase-3 subunit gamma/tau
MSFYLKYRPQNFKTVVGQEHVVTTLKNAIKHNALTHAYLFSGPRGTGKTSLARIIAKSLNCTNLQEGSEPCDECENCQAILKGRLVDLLEIDAASNRGIDEIRELREKIVFAPTQGKVKVYIIDEVHMLTKEAFNALLKTLEEPPAHAYFILATTEAHKIPETIISRCQQFSLKRITTEDIIGRLKEIAEEEKIQAEPDALELIAKTASGGMRDAIGLFEQMNMNGSVIYQEVLNKLGITGFMLIEAFFQALIDKDAGRAIEIINQVNGQGQNLNQFCGELISYFREQMLLGVNSNKNIGLIINYIDIFSEAKQQINQALIPQLPLEIAILKACGFAVKMEMPVAEEIKAEVKIVKNKYSDEAEMPKKEESVSDIGITSSLTLEEIRQNWQKIVDNIETPFIRMSFVDGEPVKFEKDNLHMEFKSSTLMEKVNNSKNQGEIIKAFQNVLKVKINLKTELKKINLQPVSVTKSDGPVSAILDMAKEVFGA